MSSADATALALVANPGRLRILTALASAGAAREDFVRLRGRTRLTDGNLASHAKRLASAGMIDVDKAFRDGKPVTTFALTRAGREALESHARDLLAALAGPAGAPAEDFPPAAPPYAAAPDADDEWID